MDLHISLLLLKSHHRNEFGNNNRKITMLTYVLLAGLSLEPEYPEYKPNSFNTVEQPIYSAPSAPIYAPPARELYQGDTCTYSHVLGPDGAMHSCRVCPTQTQCN